MNLLIFWLILNIVYSEKCPNDCNNNGLCGPLGECECYYGYDGYDCSLRKCSYGYYMDNKELECSGNGVCNTETGLCECFPGFVGGVCNIIGCKNRCSGHGQCVLSHNTRYEVNSFYPQLKKIDPSVYITYGIGMCVCDREYYGDDCSLRKCQLGYNKVKESDTGDINKIKIEIGSKPTGDTYIEYTDPFDRKWYSSKLTFATDGKIEKYGFYSFTTAGNGNVYPSDLKAVTALTKSNEELKWCYVLSDLFYTLPPGTMDLKNTTSLTYDENKKLSSGCSLQDDDGIYVKVTLDGNTPNKVSSIEITLTFGEYQSGRQGKVKFLSQTDTDIESGEIDTSVMTSGVAVAATYSYKGIYPNICGGNGKCNNDKGICECFEDYTGYNCNIKPDKDD